MIRVTTAMNGYKIVPKIAAKECLGLSYSILKTYIPSSTQYFEKK
jgi:hypothetical protein